MIQRKPIVTGYLDRTGPPKLSIVTSYVVETTLGALWDGKHVQHPNPLDEALLGPHNIKLRASRAGGAPLLMKTVDRFKPVTVTNPASGQTASIGPYWRADYQAMYAEGQDALGAEYDSAPTLLEVVIAEPGLVFDEPCIQYDLAQLEAAGWTVELFEACFPWMFAVHKAAWPTTHQDLALNPAMTPGWVETVLTAFKASMPHRGIPGNNSLRATSLGPSYDALYAALEASGGPNYFQTAQASHMGDPAATLALAVKYKAASVELPGGYQAWPIAVLEEYLPLLEANGKL